MKPQPWIESSIQFRMGTLTKFVIVAGLVCEIGVFLVTRSIQWLLILFVVFLIAAYLTLQWKRCPACGRVCKVAKRVLPNATFHYVAKCRFCKTLWVDTTAHESLAGDVSPY